MEYPKNYGSISPEEEGHSLDAIPEVRIDVCRDESKAVQMDTNIAQPFLQHLSDGESVSVVICRVCEATMDVSDQLQEFTVACPICKEATAIKHAPPGRIYVYCTCNALLVCQKTSQQVECPRYTCKRLITFTTNQAKKEGTCGLICGNCQFFFLHDTESNPLFTTCPTCQTKIKLSRFEQNDGFCNNHPIARSIFACLMIGLFIGALTYLPTFSIIYSLEASALAFVIVLVIYCLYKLM